MQMHLTSDVQIPDGLLAANALLAENSRQGFETYSGTLHQGFEVAISSTSLGISNPLYDGRVRSRYTGKERDSESGLDYFEARYYGSSMGRFMSPDYSDMTFGPDPVPNADITNPQSLNLYAYGQNNPVKNIDPDGHDCINTSNYSTNGTVTITTGSSCASDPGKYGTYVDGTIDQNSITASSKPSGTTFGYNFTSYDGQSGGAGVITQAPAYGPLEGPANLAGAGLIGSQTKMIGAFAGASVVGGVLGAGGLAIAGADLSLTSIGAMTRFQATRAAWLALKGTGAAGLINQFFKTGVIPPGLTPAMMQTYLANAIAYVESGSFPPGGVATQTARIAQLTAALGK
jgi:RHS repeat-associated protein